ncbi:MAG: C4-dicarboxylate ABC transporter substrate-binding protein, partial [Methyloceanibacter sp.]
AITGHLLLDALNIKVQELHLSDVDAIEKLKHGEIAAAMIMAGKPAPAMGYIKAADGLKLLSIPYAKELEDSYYPATFTHDDYPELVADGKTVDSVSVCAVLIAFNWDQDTLRYKRVAKFVDAFFSKFDEFQKPPRHPKWREVNFAATLEGWHRSPASQAWIDRARQFAGNEVSKSTFDNFIAQNSLANSAPVSDEQRAELFKAFLEWNKTQH